MDNQKMCIYISTPQSYSDVFDVFKVCMERNWKNCKYPIIISTDYNIGLDDKYSVYYSNNKNDNWVTRTIPVLSQIDYEYILIMMDDSIIMRPVQERYLDDIIQEMDKYNLNYCTLKPVRRGKPFKESNLLYRVRKDTPYAKNIFLGIFRRSYLLNELGDGSSSAWDIEKRWLDEARSGNRNDYHEDIVSCKKIVIKAENGVIGGKWFPSVKKRIIKMGIIPDSKRKEASVAADLRMHLGSRVGRIIPPVLRSKLKTILSKVGVKFATNK